MSLEAFIEAAERRREAERERQLIKSEEEDHAVRREEPLSSIAAIVKERGPLYATNSIRFSREEFQVLFDLVRRSLGRKGRGRGRDLGSID
jgi:hypothetical protein